MDNEAKPPSGHPAKAASGDAGDINATGPGSLNDRIAGRARTLQDMGAERVPDLHEGPQKEEHYRCRDSQV
jgi:hypothetical protein